MTSKHLAKLMCNALPLLAFFPLLGNSLKGLIPFQTQTPDPNTRACGGALLWIRGFQSTCQAPITYGKSCTFVPPLCVRFRCLAPHFPSIQSEKCIKCPLMSRTNFAYKLPATMTATALIAIGYWNCSGREKAIVVAYEQSSKKF